MMIVNQSCMSMFKKMSFKDDLTNTSEVVGPRCNVYMYFVRQLGGIIIETMAS